MDNNNRDSASRGGIAATRAAGKLAKKGAQKVARLIPTKIKVILIAMFLFIILVASITSLSSVSQSDDFLSMSAAGEEEMNTPPEEDKDSALWDKDYARKKTQEFLEIIAEFENEDAENKKTEINSYCSENGYDTELSLKYLTYSRKSDLDASDEGSASEETNKIIKSYDLSNISKKSLLKFQTISKSSDTLDKSIIKKSTRNSDGTYSYDSGNGSGDYLVIMPTGYGENGSRFLVKLANSKEITIIKAGSIAKNKTVDKSGYEIKSGGIFKIIIDKSIYKSQSIFDSEVVSLEKIESSISGDTLVTDSTGERVFAAFSIYMNNGQIIKNSDGTYVNQAGDMSKSQDKKIDYEKELKKALEKYVDSGGSFYTLDYERDEDGNILVRTEDDKSYVTPILIELDLDSIAEEIFDIDEDAIYINSGGAYTAGDVDSDARITNKEAIDKILTATHRLLFDESFDMTDEIYLSDFGGVLEWPAPGITYLTDTYGTRLHPILKTWIKHEGIDIGTPEGSIVVSAGDGTVTYAGWYSGYGYYISIDHGGGITTAYGHLKTIGVSAGDKVSRGQHIAYSGNTGRSTGPHLHFEVRIGGKSVDPEKYVKN